MNANDKTRLNEDTAQFSDYLDIPEATAVLGFKHAQYTRRLIKDSVKAVVEGKEPKFPWPDDDRPLAVKLSMGNYEKWFLNPSSAAGYAPRQGIGHTGMSRWILRINADAHSDAEFHTALEDLFGAPGPSNYLLEKQKHSSKKGKKTASEPKDYTAAIVDALSRPIPSREAMAAGDVTDNRTAAPASELDG